MAESLLRRLAKPFLKSAKAKRSKPKKSSRLGLESLEDRRLMAGFNSALANISNISTLPVLEQVPSEGSITYNASTRAVTVQGSNNYNDFINVRIDNRGTATTTDDLVSISVKNFSVPLTAQYNYTAVSRIFAYGLNGNDTIQNDTILPMTAYGGYGRDVIIGGYGADSLLGGPDNDYIDGRRGSDYIWGEDGNDALFGDDGYDTILGGKGVDYIFGGNQDDYLYGEDGNDRIYGGGGLDSINGGAGVNTIYADYGPDYNVSASGFTAFDWFDKNLKNPDVRSQARLQFRDGVLDRNDMLIVYSTISSDNYVNSTELADLKKLLSTRINMPADSRYFATKIANGDRANQWYRGGTLGNLTAGASGVHLNKLVDKWFKGGDLPGIDAGFHYEYVYGNLFVNGPNYTDVDQGSVSDCYFMAALGETAQHRSSIIQNMFGSNGDGTFVVRFIVSGTPRYVTVNRFLPARTDGTAAYAGWGSTMTSTGAFVGNQSKNSSNELWVALAEKAYVQLNESGVIGQDGTNTYAGIDFGNTGKAFGHITGKNGSFSSLSHSGIVNAMNAGKAISLSTKDSGVASGIVANHAYMLVGYNAGTDIFELFNPHGFVTGGNTVLHLTWNQIVASFDGSTSVLL